MLPRRRNNKPCTECRRQSLRCEIAADSDSCLRCSRRRVPCTGRSADRHRLPCSRCRRLKHACYHPFGGESCFSCMSAGLICNTEQWGTPGKVSKVSTQLQQQFLSYALSYHLMELFVEQIGGGLIVFGGSKQNVPVEVSVAHCRGKLGELGAADELLALICMNETVALTEHSGVVGQIPLSVQQRSALGYNRRYAIESFESRIQSRMITLLWRELERATTFDATLARLFRLALGSIRIAVDQRFVTENLESMLSLKVQNQVVQMLQSSGVDPSVAAFFWMSMFDYASLDLRQGPLARHLLQIFIPRSSDIIQIPESHFPLTEIQVKQVIDGDDLHAEGLWTSRFSKLRRVRNINFFLAATPSESRLIEAHSVLNELEQMLTASVHSLLCHPNFRKSAVANKSSRGPIHFIAKLIPNFMTIFDLHRESLWILGRQEMSFSQRSWQSIFSDGLSRWLGYYAEWCAVVIEYKESFTRWELHELVDQRIVDLLSCLSLKGSGVLEAWICRNISTATKLLPVLDYASFARYEAADYASYIRLTAERQDAQAITVVQAALNDLDLSSNDEGGDARHAVDGALNEM